MKIGGLVTCSLVDYPGKVAAVVFTQGCNMNCPWCHNRHLIPRNGVNTQYDAAQVLNILKKRREFLDAVVVSGGEPTIQPDLADFLAQVRGLGLLAKLDTNGSSPEALEEILDRNLVDCVAMDLKAPLDKYSQVCGTETNLQALLTSVAVLLRSNVTCLFRTTLNPQLTQKDLRRMLRQFKRVKQVVFQQYRPVNRHNAF